MTIDTQTMSARKRAVYENSERQAAERNHWRAKAKFFHDEDIAYLRFLIPSGLKVLELGCGTGDTLAALAPAYGVGVDFSAHTIDVARTSHPELEFHVGDIEDPQTLAALRGPFDVILIVDTLGVIDDCQSLLASLHGLCTRETRVIIAHYSHLWASDPEGGRVCRPAHAPAAAERVVGARCARDRRPLPASIRSNPKSACCRRRACSGSAAS